MCVCGLLAGPLLGQVPRVDDEAMAQAPRLPRDSSAILPARTVRFETAQGTAMNVDVSPDGRTLVFDLLGDIYTVPVSGGAATPLTRGLAVDRHPVWSPDGTQIAYIGDASGADNLWVMAADGRHARPVASERTPPSGIHTFTAVEFTAVEWTPDGQALVSDDTVYQLAGGKRPLPGVPASDRTSGRFSPDGRYRYFSHDGVRRYDRTTGETIQLARPPVAFGQPVVSPDGQWLAYISEGTRYSGLRVRKLATSEDRWLASSIDHFGVDHERYVFTRDSRAVLIGYGGKLHRIDVVTGRDRIIPFTANVQVDLGPFVYHRFRVTNDSLTVRYVRTPAVSPDGQTLVFGALQRLYTMTLPHGPPQRLLAGDEGEFDPAYSPDGQWIAYVTWSDAEGGHVWRMPAKGGTPERLTTVAGYYQLPAWSPDGATLAVLKGGTKHFRPESDQESNRGWLQVLPSTGGRPHTVRANVSRQHPAVFTSDGQRLLIREGEPGSEVLSSVRLDGRDHRVLAWFFDIPAPGYVPAVMSSPNGRYVAYIINEALYLAPLPATPDAVHLGTSSGAVPVVRLSYGALDPRWDPDGKMLRWFVGNQLFSVDPDRAIAAAGRDPRGVTPDIVILIHLTAPRHVAQGTLALRGARVITMKGEEVLENATLVITNDRITAVGPAASVVIPEGATVLDVAGKTIMPGLVDLHLHFQRRGENFRQYDWGYLVALAYGVTTARDPSNRTMQFGDAELVETGQLLGPRLFTTAKQIWRVESLDEARGLVQYRKMMGGIVVKQGVPTRRQRQWVIQAASEAGLNVTGHIRDYDMVLDGATGFEHALGRIYGDAARLVAEGKTWYTPTLLVEGALPYFLARYRWTYDAAKYRRFVPDGFLKFRCEITHCSGALEQLDDPNYKRVVDVARMAANIAHLGGHITVGSHGDDPGVGTHWELWALQMGGLTNHEALRAATLRGAEGLGMQQDLGSIEVGKIADLLVLERNPLEQIENTLSIRYVMKNGILYDGGTLDTIWPERRALPGWMLQESGR